MVYRIDNRRKISRGNGLKIFFTVAICSVIGIGIFSYIINPISPEENIKLPEITYQEKQQPDTNIEPHVTQQAYTSTNTNQPVISDPRSLEHQIHEEINNIRQQGGLKPLQYDEKISGIAREHSRDMAVNNYFDHTSVDGKTVQNRFFEAKYPCYPSENIEQAVLGDSPLSIVQLWMSSSGHKANILSYSSVEGIGVYIDGQSVYITEDLC